VEDRDAATAETMHNKEAGSVVGLVRNHPRAVLIVLAFTMGGSLYFYTFTTYMQKYLVNTAHMDAQAVTFVMTAVLIVFMLLQPVFGALSDRIGRRNNMILFTALGSIAAAPLLFALGGVSSPYTAFILILLALAIASFYTSISGVVKAELFPAEVRALGVGLTYAVANAMFGGTAEYVALWLKSSGRSLVRWYVAEWWRWPGGITDHARYAQIRASRRYGTNQALSHDLHWFLVCEDKMMRKGSDLLVAALENRVSTASSACQ
jgi:MHS family alpha-ketoglutarate permease-like MFS transporter